MKFRTVPLCILRGKRRNVFKKQAEATVTNGIRRENEVRQRPFLSIGKTRSFQRDLTAGLMWVEEEWEVWMWRSKCAPLGSTSALRGSEKLPHESYVQAMES